MGWVQESRYVGKIIFAAKKYLFQSKKWRFLTTLWTIQLGSSAYLSFVSSMLLSHHNNSTLSGTNHKVYPLRRDEYCDNLQGCPGTITLTFLQHSHAWLQFNKFTLMLKITTREALLKTILILRFVGSEIYCDF